MSLQVEYGDGELASSSFWLPSPLMQDNPAQSISRGSIGASTGSALRPGDWRRAAAAETGGEPVQAPTCELRYPDNTPNIDDVHSPASVNFDIGTGIRMASPLVPRALAANSGLSGRGPFNAAGQAAVSRQLGSPSSVASLSAGEASFRLDSPELDPLQYASPSEMSPVRPRRTMPIDSELSTPGSDGYASPSVLFVIGPSSLMRSSVQNPLYVDRPTPSEGDINIAKALVMSPCADRSPGSRLPRCTIESGWSSSSLSAGQSISLNPSQQDDKLSPLPHLEATSSPRAWSGRRPMPSLPQMDFETPRRIIKCLSMSQDAVFGLAAAARALSPRARCPGVAYQGAGDAATATPCSADAPAWVEKLPTSANATGFECTSAAEQAAHGLYSDEAALHQTGSAKAANVANGRNGHPSLDLDDTIVAGRTLDQTPRKATRSASQTGDQQWHVGCKGTADKERVQLKLVQQSAAPQEGVELGSQGTRRSSGALRTFASWLLLSFVVLLVGSHIGSMERWNPAPSAMPAAGYKTGPVCFREPYPGASSMTATDSPTLSTANTTNTQTLAVSTSVQVPFCWRQLPNCHVLDGLLSPVLDPWPASLATGRYANQSGYATDPLADAEPQFVGSEDPAVAPNPQPGPVDIDALQHLPSASGYAEPLFVGSEDPAVAPDPQLGPVDTDALQHLPRDSGYASPLVGDSDITLRQVLATAAWVAEHTTQKQAAATVDGVGSQDEDFGVGVVNVAKPLEHDWDFLPGADDFAPEHDAPIADSPTPSHDAAAEQHMQELAALPDMLESAVEATTYDTGSHASSSTSAVVHDAAEIGNWAPDLTSGDSSLATSVISAVVHDAAETVGTADSASDSASGVPPLASSTTPAVVHGDAETVVPADTAPGSTSGVSALLETSSSGTDITDAKAGPQVVSLQWVLARRVYGWNIGELLLGIIVACLAGGLLAWTVEHLLSHIQRHQRVVKRNGSGACAVQQSSPPPVGRIPRHTWHQGASGASKADDQVAPGSIPTQAAYNDVAQREQGTGSLVWTGNKLVYFEG